MDLTDLSSSPLQKEVNPKELATKLKKLYNLNMVSFVSRIDSSSNKAAFNFGTKESFRKPPEVLKGSSILHIAEEDISMLKKMSQSMASLEDSEENARPRWSQDEQRRDQEEVKKILEEANEEEESEMRRSSMGSKNEQLQKKIDEAMNKPRELTFQQKPQEFTPVGLQEKSQSLQVNQGALNFRDLTEGRRDSHKVDPKRATSQFPEQISEVQSEISKRTHPVHEQSKLLLEGESYLN